MKRRAGRYIYEKSVPRPAPPLTSLTIRSERRGKARSKAAEVDNDKVVEDHPSNSSISNCCSSMSADAFTTNSAHLHIPGGILLVAILSR